MREEEKLEGELFLSSQPKKKKRILRVMWIRKYGLYLDLEVKIMEEYQEMR